jgi:translation initiation factor 2 gamma subunit (eIF-2gamma)
MENPAINIGYCNAELYKCPANEQYKYYQNVTFSLHDIA